MVAFNFGDERNTAFQSFDVNWFRFAKSCMLLDPFEECNFRTVSTEILKLIPRTTCNLIPGSSPGFISSCLGAEAFGRIIVFIQDGVELMFF